VENHLGLNISNSSLGIIEKTAGGRLLKYWKINLKINEEKIINFKKGKEKI
jgi:hypothetical protein